MLARALTQDTAIVLLDEITAHLDYVHRHKSFELLKKLAKENNKTIILATHEIDLSLKYCDVLLVLHQYKIQKIEAADYEDKALLNKVFEGFIS
jgi:iron complex transport system ATP-binding protein